MKASGWVALAGSVAVVAAGFLVSPKVVKADGVDSMQMIKLLADVKGNAVQLKDDAAMMQHFGQLDIKWEAHASTVGRMRHHVVAMNEELRQLEAGIDTAAPWEQAVIERIVPYLAALAQDNEAVIDRFDEHPSLFGTPAANAYLGANAKSATYLSALIVNFVENGTLRQTIEDYDQPEDACALIGMKNPVVAMKS